MPRGFRQFLAVCTFLALSTSGLFAADPFKVLIFSKTNPKGYRHASIPAATASLQALGAKNGFTADATEDAGVFTADGLKPYQVLVFLNTDGDVLDDSQQEALKHFIEGGHGWVGLHAASNTQKNWPWFTGLVGATLKTDRDPMPGTLHVVEPHHPATEGLPETITRTDQWFQYKELPRDVQILVTLDGTHLPGYTMNDAAYPASWCHLYDGGRAFYTTMGHGDYFSEPFFASHILGAIRWARGEP